MEKLNFLKGLFVIAISLTLVQCTSDDPIPGPAGAQGATGVNGINGTNGTNGIDGGNVCLSCHNVDFKVVQPATYAVSDHALGAALPGRNNSCLNCHSDEGYKASYATGDITTTFTTTATTQTIFNCTTCHSGGHASAALAISGKDAALRSAGFYKLNQKTAAGADVIIDYKDNSNACVHCHQPRRTDVTGLAPATSGTNIGKIALSSSTGPHYGVQSAMLEGIFASEVAGTVAYPAKGTAVHRTGASCVQCHMGKAKDGKGNHTFVPVLDNCKTCHTGAGVVNYNINGGQTKIKNLMLELAEEMVRLRPADFRIANYTGTKPFTAPNVFTDAAFSANQLTVIATRQYDSTIAADVRITKGYWNWRFVYQDHSYGLHNPKYTEALMKNTVADLKLLP
ncbi:MAG: ammonia-forming cytochrome c nitrite reductase subunit c552 [Flavobacteriaceae bacterium]|nr:ammonia-forming cytochrome c nitrite reductase subunit c552 [Flavobacteriaceae bacterium]